MSQSMTSDTSNSDYLPDLPPVTFTSVVRTSSPIPGTQGAQEAAQFGFLSPLKVEQQYSSASEPTPSKCIFFSSKPLILALFMYIYPVGKTPGALINTVRYG